MTATLDTPGNRNPQWRYAGYNGEPLTKDATADQRAAWEEGCRAGGYLPMVPPPGWRLVPYEHTPEMMKAAAETPGLKAVDDVLHFHQVRSGTKMTWPGEGSPIAQVWRAMLDVAPTPPALRVAPHPEPVVATAEAGDVEWTEADIQRLDSAIQAMRNKRRPAGAASTGALKADSDVMFQCARELENSAVIGPDEARRASMMNVATRLRTLAALPTNRDYLRVSIDDPVLGREYESGQWSRRNWEAAIRDQIGGGL